MTIGERIKAAREKAGLTQVQLGEKVGVSGVAIMRYENGTREPRYDRLKRISDALGISIYELFDGSTVDADGTINIWPAPQNASGSPPKLVEEEGPISTPEVVEHGATTEELEALIAKLQDGKPLLLSPDKLAKLKNTPKEQIAAALDRQEAQERGNRDTVIVALRTQMEKIRQRYGPTAFPEFDALERLLRKFQSDAITQGEQEQIKTLLEAVQNRLKQYGEMAPSPQSTLSRQDEELRERWNNLSLSEIFVIPGNHDIVPAPLDDLHGAAKLLKAPVFKMDAIAPPGREARFNKKLVSTRTRDDKQAIVQGLVETITALERGEGIVVDVGSSMADLTATPQHRITAALDKLNEEGQEKAAERVEELTEIPRYQAQEPPTAPAQDTPAPQEGTDTTPPSEASQEPPEAVIMICPICGQHLRGDRSTGEAYCNRCKRSFPLPRILK